MRGLQKGMDPSDHVHRIKDEDLRLIDSLCLPSLPEGLAVKSGAASCILAARQVPEVYQALFGLAPRSRRRFGQTREPPHHFYECVIDGSSRWAPVAADVPGFFAFDSGGRRFGIDALLQNLFLKTRTSSLRPGRRGAATPGVSGPGYRS
jgi:hypothetical protein